MNTREKWVLGGLAAAVVAVVVLGLRPDIRGSLQAKFSTTDAAADADGGMFNPCGSWVPGAGDPTLNQRHALYRRPHFPSPHFSMLSAGGWDWFCNPPSEQG